LLEAKYGSPEREQRMGREESRIIKHEAVPQTGIQAPRSSIPRRPVSGLDQSEEPKSSGAGTGQGIVFVSNIYDGAEATSLALLNFPTTHLKPL
jgi:hypothetical protein